MKEFVKRAISNIISFVKRRYKLSFIILAVLIVCVGTFVFVKGKSTSKAASYTEYTVKKGNVEVTVSGTGSITSSYRQDLSPNVSGTVTAVYFKEGDKVKQGDLLVQLDDSTAAASVKRTKLSIEQSQSDLEDAKESIRNLSVAATIAGQVSNITVSSGDNVNKGQEICTLTDTGHLKLTIPFNGAQAKNFYVGQDAVVYLQDYMDTVTGKVTYISNYGKVVAGGGSTYDVEISITNPGVLKSGIYASAQIDNVMSLDSSTLSYQDVQKVRALSSGTVKSIAVRDSQYVSKGQTLVTLVNDDLQSTILSSEIKLQDYYAQLESEIKQQEEYSIHALFDGTIIQQDLKVGDVVKANDVLTTVSNPDAMEFSITVDELDIAKMKAGQSATVTVDALTDKTFAGTVSKIAQVGTSSNGVTTYDVTIVITSPQDIKEGMNASASIVVERKENVLVLPTTAVQKMKNTSFVYVKGTAAATTQKSGQQAATGTQTTANSTGAQNSANSTTAQTTTSISTAKSQSNSTNRPQSPGSAQKSYTGSVKTTAIKTGINNDNYIEVTSGLSEGDVILIPVTTTSKTTTTTQQGGFGMMGMDGGPPSSGGQSRNSSSSSSQGGGTKSGN